MAVEVSVAVQRTFTLTLNGETADVLEMVLNCTTRSRISEMFPGLNDDERGKIYYAVSTIWDNLNSTKRG